MPKNEKLPTDRQREYLNWLQKCASEGTDTIKVKRPDPTFLSMLRGLEAQGFITMTATTGYLYPKTGRMVWNWAVSLTDAGKDA